MQDYKKTARRGAVRITLPASVAYDPEALKKGIANVVERLGCPQCFSGADCFFTNERALVIDPKLAVNPVIAGEPEPLPWSQNTYTVGLSGGVRHNLDKVLIAVEKAIDKIGAHPCISGFDFHFQDVIRTVVVNEKLEATRFDQPTF